MYDYLFVIFGVLLAFVIGRELMLERRLNELKTELRRESEEKSKSLPLKKRKRYIVFQIIGDYSPEKPEDLNSLLQTLVTGALGELGYAECRPYLMYFSKSRRRGIVRTYRECVDKIISILSINRKLSDKNALIIPIRVTGTLKKARWYLFEKK